MNMLRGRLEWEQPPIRLYYCCCSYRRARFRAYSNPSRAIYEPKLSMTAEMSVGKSAAKEPSVPRIATICIGKRELESHREG